MSFPENEKPARPDQHPADAVIGIYERHARAFDEDRSHNGWNDRLWHERFAGLLHPGASVLDLGCGSGRPVAEFLAAQGYRLTGVDSSAAMIAMCRERLPDHEWMVADMREVKHDACFDGILAWDNFFFLRQDDQRKMFATFAALAAPGCVLMFNAGPRAGEAYGSYRGETLHHASLDPEDYTALLRQHGFEIVLHVVEDEDAGGRTAWIARRSRDANGGGLSLFSLAQLFALNRYALDRPLR